MYLTAQWLPAEWIINDIHRTHAHHRPHIRFDYSDPGFQEHMKGVWKRLHKAGLKGVKFDYPETGWAHTGGFEDSSYTTTSAYRKIFDLCKSGLGKDSYVHERNLGGTTHEDVPCLDITAGIVDLQRVWTDSSHFEPEMASRIGLRWYKSRSVFHYYPDGKSFFQDGKALPKHLRRAFLTLIGFLGGRLEIGTSFNMITDEMVHDMTRLYPIFSGTRSPRPVDMLMGKPHPEVYSYKVDDYQTQVVLVNNGKKSKIIKTSISGNSTEDGGLDLDRKGKYHTYDFWDQKYLGLLNGSDLLSKRLRIGEAAMISLRKVKKHPQVISTNRHIMQGMVECRNIEWDGKNLTGELDVIGEEAFILTVALNGHRIKKASVSDGECKIKKVSKKGIIQLICESPVNRQIHFELS